MDEATSVKYDIEQNREALSGTLEAIGDRVSPARVIERRRNRMVVWMRNTKDRVMGTGEHMADRMGSAADRVQGAPAAAMDEVRESTRGAPLVAGGIAFGIGVLLGSLAPPSRTEQQLGRQAREVTEPLKDQVRQAGHEMVDDLREPVQQAVQSVKESAKDGAQEVRSSVSDSTDQVRREASTR